MTADVVAVVPTVGHRPDFLDRSITSLAEIPSIVVVDAPASSKTLPHGPARVLWTGGDGGFAVAAQCGVDAAEAEYVLLLNDDAWILPGDIARLAQVLDRNPGIAGVAPKIRLAANPAVLNSVGTVLMRDGWSGNRGIGEVDSGQYDVPARVFGCHFAVALIRRRLFDPAEVGSIDTTYKLYYEDVDWCLRANLLGWTFVTEPAAVAFHEHSATVSPRGHHYGFRYQERNLLWTVLKCFEVAGATRVVTRRMAAHLRNIVLARSLGGPSRHVLTEAVSGFPRILEERRRIQSRRRVPDKEIFALSEPAL